MSEAAKQFEAEVKVLLRRHGLESSLNVYEALGALELVKAYLIDLVNRAEAGERPPDEDDFGAGYPVPP